MLFIMLSQNNIYLYVEQRVSQHPLSKMQHATQAVHADQQPKVKRETFDSCHKVTE